MWFFPKKNGKWKGTNSNYFKHTTITDIVSWFLAVVPFRTTARQRQHLHSMAERLRQLFGHHWNRFHGEHFRSPWANSRAHQAAKVTFTLLLMSSFEGFAVGVLVLVGTRMATFWAWFANRSSSSGTPTPAKNKLLMWAYETSWRVYCGPKQAHFWPLAPPKATCPFTTTTLQGKQTERFFFSWEIKEKICRRTPVIGKHTKKVTCGSWSTENLIAVGSEDKTISVSNTDGDTLRVIALRAEPADIQFSEMKMDERVGTENTVMSV